MPDENMTIGESVADAGPAAVFKSSCWAFACEFLGDLTPHVADEFGGQLPIFVGVLRDDAERDEGDLKIQGCDPLAPGNFLAVGHQVVAGIFVAGLRL